MRRHKPGHPIDRTRFPPEPIRPPPDPIVAPFDKTTGTFSYTRRATPATTGLDYTVWTSTNLGTWTQDTGATEGTVTTSGEVETVPVTISSGLLTNPKLFIQVRAD